MNEDLNMRVRRLGILIVIFILIVTIISLVSIQSRQALLSPFTKSSKIKPTFIYATIYPSKQELIPGKPILYTISLTNANLRDAIVEVIFPLTGNFKYVAGTITEGGIFDAEKGTLLWKNKNIQPGEERKLQFQVQLNGDVEFNPSKLITNIVEISDRNSSSQNEVDILIRTETSNSWRNPGIWETITASLSGYFAVVE